MQADAREAATSGATNTDILVFHGCTDAPTVDVFESAVVNATLVDDISYGGFDGYLEVPTLDFTLQVRTADNTTTVATYSAPLSTLGLDGAAITVLASGFLTPANNSNGPGFGLWVALPSGGPLVQLPVVTGIEESVSVVTGVNAWPNPANDRITLQLNAVTTTTANLELIDVAGRVVKDQRSVVVAQGTTSMNMDVQDLTPGAYTLRLIGADVLLSVPFQIVR